MCCLSQIQRPHEVGETYACVCTEGHQLSLGMGEVIRVFPLLLDWQHLLPFAQQLKHLLVFK